MNTRRPVLASVIIALLVGGTAIAKDPALSSLTMEHFRDTAVVTENPGDGTAIVSTEPGFVEHTGLMRMVWHDEFLRAVIDRKTGRKTIQVYAWVIYPGSLRTYQAASYQTAEGPRSVPVIPLGKEVVNCAVGDCTYTERVAFPVDEELMRRLAASRAAGKAEDWSFKLVAKSGPEYAGVLSSAEIAGFLAKVDDYAARPAATTASTPGSSATTSGSQSLTPGSAAATAGASAMYADTFRPSPSRELGIRGMSVAGTEEQPDRAGILVIGVDAGSVAHQAGIIVGDILYAFGTVPLKTSADLQTAVAGRTAGSAVAIKLYRGTSKMTVNARF